MEAEKVALSATMDSISEVKEEHEEDITKCEKAKKAALHEKAGFEAELKELRQIANPAVRYNDTQAAEKAATAKSLEKYGGFEAAGLIQESVWTQKTCEKFV